MNIVILIGRTTKDPELKYSQSGKAYCSFTLAVNREFKREETDFINCKAFDKKAEAIAQYVEKGNRIAVEGRIQTGSYEKNGTTFYTTEVLVEKVEFLESKKSNNNTKNDEVDEDFPF